MKKKLFIATLTVAMAVAIGWNLEQKKEASSNMSNLALTNIEALAAGESGKKYKYVYPGSDPSVACVCSGSGNISCC